MPYETMTGGPLRGVRVVDAPEGVTGPFAARLLGDLEAEVLKVEPPGGVRSRAYWPPDDGSGCDSFFECLNWNKVGVVLDVEEDAGLARLRDFLADAGVLVTTGYAEREAALRMLERRGRRRGTLGADKAYDTADFVTELRARRITPHVAQNSSGRRNAVDGRTTLHTGYGRSQRRRKLVEEVFGWVKTVAGARKLCFRGVDRNRVWLELTAAAYDLVRVTRLEAASA